MEVKKSILHISLLDLLQYSFHNQDALGRKASDIQNQIKI